MIKKTREKYHCMFGKGMITSCTIICLLILAAWLTVSFMRETYGPFVRPTEVEGAVYSGSTTMGGAVLLANPRQECLQRCFGGLEGSAFLDETSMDERKQLCFASC